MTIKAILFDHDGTLVDSETIHYRLWCEVLEKFGIEFPLAEYRSKHVGVPCQNNAQILLSDYSIPASIEELVNLKNAKVKNFFEREAFSLIPDVENTVTRLHGHYQLAVVSGSEGFAVQSTLKFHQLGELFDTVVTGDQVPNNKPFPDVYLSAMNYLGLSSDECIAVEDTANGMNAALAAGLTCIVIPNEYTQHQDFSKASVVLNSIAELIPWLDQLSK